MISYRSPFRLMALLLVFGAISGLVAARASTPAPKLPPPPIDHRVLITAVDAAKQEITVVHKSSGQSQVYKIDDMTQITVENSPGSFKDIKVGQQAFTIIERDQDTIDNITVGTADAPPIDPYAKQRKK